MRIVKMPYMHGRKGKCLAFRRRIPLLLQPIIGRGEFWQVSADTKDEKIYNLHYPDLLRQYDEAMAAAEAELRGGYQVVPHRRSEIITHRVERGGFGSARIWRGLPPPDLHEIEPGVYVRVGHPDHPDTAARMKLADAKKVAPYREVCSDWAAIVKRDKPPTKRERAKADKLRALRGLFAGLKHDDMNRVQAAELIGYVEGLALTKLDSATIRDRVIQIKAIFKWAEETKRIDSNPAAGLKGGSKSDNFGERFDDEEREALIRAAVALPRQLHRSNGDNLALKWLTLFGAYHGRRMAEIAEARMTHFRTLKDGTLVLNFREDIDRTLKNGASRGDIPLHPRILAEGFAEFLGWVRREHGEGGVLFPMIPDTGGRRATYASNATNPWIRGVLGEACNGRSYKSWRQSIATLLEGQGVSRDRARFLVGHAPVDIHAKHYLEHPVPDLLAALALLPDPLQCP